MDALKLRVAIVEDDAAVVTALERLLRATGFEPMTFTSAERFLDQAGFDGLACLILDVHLPGASGFDLLTRLSRALPVILISGDDSAGTRQRAKQSTCAAFLIKPIDASDLLAALRRCSRPLSA